MVQAEDGCLGPYVLPHYCWHSCTGQVCSASSPPPSPLQSHITHTRNTQTLTGTRGLVSWLAQTHRVPQGPSSYKILGIIPGYIASVPTLGLIPSCALPSHTETPFRVLFAGLARSPAAMARRPRLTSTPLEMPPEERDTGTSAGWLSTLGLGAAARSAPGSRSDLGSRLGLASRSQLGSSTGDGEEVPYDGPVTEDFVFAIYTTPARMPLVRAGRAWRKVTDSHASLLFWP